jgi:UDP-glucose 4-epimerase
MKILFTGASSFTGTWFVKELSSAGHEIIAPLLKVESEYTGTRKERVSIVKNLCKTSFNCAFGSETFLDLINSQSHIDLICCHAADVTDYKSPNFDFLEASKKNTRNINNTLLSLKDKGCTKVLITGSVFEPGEGSGSDNLRAVSPYGLSKALTAQIFEYFCTLHNMSLRKFVIPNPFGPLEEERFTSYLIKTWLEGKTASVATPDYIRDNVPVSLLAKAYRDFAETINQTDKINPSYYVESQGDFAKRFAKEMEPRLGIPCKVALHEQKDFSEPLKRINTTRLDPKKFQWNEEEAWNELATYYKTKYDQQ